MHRTQNNVTYVQLEAEDDVLAEQPMYHAKQPVAVNRNRSMPYCPPPDYPGAPTTEPTMISAGTQRKPSSSNESPRENSRNFNGITTTRTASERQQQHHSGTIAKPLYSRDETTVIRRFWYLYCYTTNKFPKSFTNECPGKYSKIYFVTNILNLIPQIVVSI